MSKRNSTPPPGLVEWAPGRWCHPGDPRATAVSEPPPAVASEPQWRCTKCGQVGTVGRCCGLNTRVPLNDAARAEVAKPDTITATIACRTVSEANSHQHWRERQRRAKEQRLLSFVTVPSCVRNMAPPLRITLTRLAPRRLDSDNLAGSMKAVRDGVADAVGIDDGDQRLDWQYGQRTASEYGVEIVIQRVEG
jgi:hypothetical protein